MRPPMAIQLTRNSDGSLTLPGYAARNLRDFFRELGHTLRDAPAAFAMARAYPPRSDKRKALEAAAREGDGKARWMLRRIEATDRVVPVLQGLPPLVGLRVRHWPAGELLRVEQLKILAQAPPSLADRRVNYAMGSIAARGAGRGSFLAGTKPVQEARAFTLRKTLAEHTQAARDVGRAMRAASGDKAAELEREQARLNARVERLQGLVIHAERLVEAARARDRRGGIRQFNRVCVANDQLYRVEKEYAEAKRNLHAAGRLYRHLTSDAAAERVARLAKLSDSELAEKGLAPIHIGFVRSYALAASRDPFGMPLHAPAGQLFGSASELAARLDHLDRKRDTLDKKLQRYALDSARPVAGSLYDYYHRHGYTHAGSQAVYEEMIRREWRTIFVRGGTPRGYYTEAQLREIYEEGSRLYHAERHFEHDTDDHRAYHHSYAPRPRTLTVFENRGYYRFNEKRVGVKGADGRTRYTRGDRGFLSIPTPVQRIDSDQYLRRFTTKDNGVRFPEYYDEERERRLEGRDDARRVLFSLPPQVRPYDLAAKYDPRWKPHGRVWMSFGRDITNDQFTILQEGKSPTLRLHYFPDSGTPGFATGVWGAAVPGPWKALGTFLTRLQATTHPDQIAPLAQSLFFHLSPGRAEGAVKAYEAWLEGRLADGELSQAIAGTMSPEAKEALRMIAIRARELEHPQAMDMDDVPDEAVVAHIIRERAVSGFRQDWAVNTLQLMARGGDRVLSPDELQAAARTLGLNPDLLEQYRFSGDERFAATPTGAPRAPRMLTGMNLDRLFEMTDNEEMTRQMGLLVRRFGRSDEDQDETYRRQNFYRGGL